MIGGANNVARLGPTALLAVFVEQPSDLFIAVLVVTHLKA
jgi:hypothetical protein